MSFDRPEWVEVEAHGPVTVLHVTGSVPPVKGNALDDERRYRVGSQELSQIADDNAPNILFNFNRVKQVRGPELTPLMRLAMRVRQRNGRIGACHLPEGMQDLLIVSRLDRLVTVYDDQEQAIRDMLLPVPACV